MAEISKLISSGVKQRTFEIGGVRVGGIPGKRPILLIGSIFYKGHKIFIDEKKAEFDREAARRLLSTQEEFSDRTGNPCMVDVVISSVEAIPSLVGFIASETDLPMLLDGINWDIRVEALKYIKQVGLQGRTVYNSLTPDFKQLELDAIKDSELKSSVLLAYYTKDFTSRGRTSAIKGLLPKIEEIGVTMPLIDTCVLDLPTLGQACQAVYEIKKDLGLPSGCGAHNAVSLWSGLRAKLGDQAVKACLGASVSMVASFGGDFVLYGPIENAPFIFPSAAMADVALSQLLIEQRDRPDPGHPRYRVG
jgi:tetrahydromethanopterin S-methyltransferase subunit H